MYSTTVEYVNHTNHCVDVGRILGIAVWHFTAGIWYGKVVVFPFVVILHTAALQLFKYNEYDVSFKIKC